MFSARVSVLIVIALRAGVPTWAEINQWTPIGPAGGMVTGLAVDSRAPNVVFATTSGGFFRSTDVGSSWTVSNDGLRDAHLQSLVVAGGTVYVAGDDGVSRSDDQGLHFRRLATAPTLATALAAGPGANPTLYAAGINAGAWRSDDGGTTWTAINEGLEVNQPHPAAVIHAFLVHPRRPNLLWAGSEFGIYRSVNGGGRWARASAPFGCFVTSLALDRGGTLYAGCYVDPAFTAPPLPPALLVSYDLGLTWHPVVHGLAACGVTALLADPAGTVWAGTQDAGIFRTMNHGRSWSPVRTGIEGQTIGALAQALGQPSHLLAGSGLSLNGVIPQEGLGIFRTTSAGASWALSSRGLTATTIVAVAADPTAQGLLSAADPYQGVFRTRSGGAAWRLLNRGLPPNPQVEELVADTATTGILYASAGVSPPAFYKHGADPTAPWQLLASVPAGCFGPLTAGALGQLFVGGFSDGGFVASSEDAGTSWRVGGVGLIVIESIAVAPSNPSRVYASGFVASHAPPGPTFVRSDDGGVTWTGESSVATTAPHGLAVDPSDANLIYAAADAVQRSRDGGVTWETLVGGANASLVKIAPRAPNTIYAATGFPGDRFIPPPTPPRVIVSDDGGATWQPLVEGLPPNISVIDLAFDPVDSSVVYAATDGGGVLVLQRVP